jgi:hypothetical protein
LGAFINCGALVACQGLLQCLAACTDDACVNGCAADWEGGVAAYLALDQCLGGASDERCQQ